MTAAWEWLAAALFAPVAVWVLWRGQALGVELLRRSMVKLVRHAEWLYLLVSWFGTLLHELSHATVLLLSGHGVRDFHVRPEQGHVLPRRTIAGPWGTLTFLAAAMAPLYGVPALVLAGMVWFSAPGLVPWAAPGPGWQPALAVFRDLAVAFPADLGRALAGLDLRDPGHLLVFFLVLLGAPGSRPSFVRGTGLSGRDEGDIAVVRRRIRREPWTFVLFLLVVYGAYFALVPWLPQAYWWPFQLVWAVALTGIAIALLGSVWWFVAYQNTRIAPGLAWLAPLGFLAGQVVPRALGWGWSPVLLNAASLLAWVLLVLVLGRVAPRRGPYGRF